MCFDAVADAERTIEFSIDGDENSEYAILNAVAVGAEPAPVVSTVTTEKQQLQYTFNATTTDATARLILSVGKSDTNIRFDNIGMYAGESCGDPSNLPKKADAVIPTDLTRADCPAPPPAVIGKTPPASRNLTLSNNQLNSLFKPQTPFAASNWTLPWNLYTPSEAANNTTGEKFPLIVVLHGGYGSEGADGNVTRDVLRYAVGVQNTGLLLEPSVSNFPAYVVAPHCKMPQAGAVMVDGKTINQPACAFRTNEWASAGGAGFNVQGEPSLAGAAVIELVEHIIDTYDIDPSRIYVTGNSMGGGGTWEVIIRRPDLFAAAVPVSGHTPASRFFENIAKSKMPIWAFAGSNDFVNPVTDTRNAITQIADQNGCAWLTEYTNTGHDDVLWASPYQESELWSWLFAQQLPAKTQEDDTQNNDSSNSSAPASSVEKIGADYEAPKTSTKPTIDGQIESAWDIAPWDAIDVPWLFDDLVPPSSPQDFSGRYKAMWDADKLYVLVEITDDVIRDLQADPVRLYWQDDTVEIFLDENRSGGSHLQGRNNDVNDANAFAYHLSTLGDTVDTYKTERRVFGDEHVQFKRVSVTATKSVWELAITIWGEDYTFEAKQNPVTLTAGKVMGFTLSYIDNDGNNGTKRESFIGSVDTPGHQNNRGFVTADDFGTLQLVD